MAESNNGGLVFALRLDNSLIKKDVDEAEKLFNNLSKGASKSGESIDNQLGNSFIESGKKAQAASSNYNRVFQDLYIAAANAGAKVRTESSQSTASISEDLNKLNSGFTAITGLAGAMFLGVSAKGIVDQMFQTRSYFQDAESSMKVFLGNAEKGSKFFRELKDYAFYNMFSFQDLVGASKQLISYGTDAKDVTGILDKLSNVATGTGSNLNDMIGMYNKAKSIGKVDSQGLESWAARGVLVKDTLKEMGETVGSTGVTFQQLNKVLDKVTGEGGMFHNLMAEQLNNLSASAAQLEDNMTAMWAEMGEKAEPYMKAAIDLAGTLVENYQNIADVVIDVAKVYGAYKLVDISGLQGLIEQTQAESTLVDTFKEHAEEIQNLLSSEQQQQLTLSDLKEGTLEYAKAVQEMINNEKQNATNQLENVSQELTNMTSKKEKLEELLAATNDEIQLAQKSGDTKKIEALQTGQLALQEELSATAKNINVLQGKKEIATINASIAAKKADTLATMQATTTTKAATTASLLWNKATTVLGAGVKKFGAILKSTMLSNPYALAIAGAIALISLIHKLISMQSASEQAQQSLTEANKKYVEASEKDIQQLDGYIRQVEKAKEGTKEYEQAKEKLKARYPDYFKNVDDEITKTELLTTKYEELKKAIEDRHKSEVYANAIEENESKMAENISSVVDTFSKKMEKEGIKINSRLGQDLTEAFKESVEKGYSSEEIEAKFGEIGKQVNEIRDSVSFEWGDLAYATPLGMYALVKDLYDVSDATSAVDFIQKAWNNEINFTSSELSGEVEKIKALNGALQDVNDEMAESVNLIEQQNNAEAKKYWDKSVLERYKEELDNIEGQLKSFSQLDYDFLELPEQKEKLRKLQKERIAAQRNLEIANKKIMGEDYNAQKAALNKQIESYKQFANEYAKIETERLKQKEKLNNDRDKKGANSQIIDIQIADVDKKADDNIQLLFAKYYNVSQKTAEQIKEKFAYALGMPVEDAKKRLLEITTRLEKIKNAASKGSNIATKEEQAALLAEKAGLEQSISKNETKKDWSEKTKKYEDFYNELIAIANEKQSKIAEIQSRFNLGEINKSQLDSSIEQIEQTFAAQANIMRQGFGMSEGETTDLILSKLGQATDAKVSELVETLEKYGNQIDFLKSKLADGIDVTEELDNIQKAYNETMENLEFVTSSGIINLEAQIQAAQQQLTTLETRAANGEDVSEQIAKTKAQISQMNSLFSYYKAEQENVIAETKQLTEAEIKLQDILAKKAAFTKAQKNFNLIKNSVNTVIDSCDGLSDTTKEVLNSTIELGDILFDTVGNLLEYAEQSAQAMVTAGVGASEAVKTAEKGSVILAVIGAAIQAVMAIVKIFNKNNKTAKAEKNIKKIESRVKDLEREYDKLGNKIENAYGAKATTLIKQQDQLLAQKAALLQQEIREEKSKKNKDRDDDRIKELEQEIEDIQAQRAMTEQTITEKLLGKDYKSVLEDFSGSVMSAMDDAETSVQDAVKNISKSIKKSAIQQQLMAKLQPTTDEYAKALGDAMTDGIISQSENEVLERLENSIAGISEQYLGQFDDLWEKAEKERNGVSEGITNMSQDTAEEMNGRLTQIQSHTLSISENCKLLTQYSAQQLNYLSTISNNTLQALTNQNKIIDMLSDVNVKGIKIK